MTRANRKSPTIFMILVALMMTLVALIRDIRAEPPTHNPLADAETAQH